MVCYGTSQCIRSESLVSQQTSLRQFLRNFDKSRSTRYIAAFADINDDGIAEAIVYLMGKEWCGSAGCNTLILSRNGNSWKLISKITITRPPIRVLHRKTNGWHDIGVWVQGGGVHSGYEADLSFNGEGYPQNPSIPPAKRIRDLRGSVVIRSAQAPTLLDESSTGVR
jgi:hypothetical protein